MHRVNQLMIKIIPLVLYIGIFPCVLNADVEEPDPDVLAKTHMVFVEPSNVLAPKNNSEWLLLPYKERRSRWGYAVDAGYCSYEPLRYEPNFANKTYRQVYGQPALAMIEAKFTVKRNLSLGSLGGEISVGTLQNGNADPNFVGSDLSLTPIHVGAAYYMDTIWNEPYFVPFVSGGGYEMIYHEKLGGNAVHGNTAVAGYLNGGFALQLDWIDKHAARVSYEDSGIQSSYIYAEARKYFTSSAKKDPDFGNDVSVAAGLRVEF